MSDFVDRRSFIGTTASALGLGLGMTGCASMPGSAVGPVAAATPLGDSLGALVNETPLMDTHEHFPPEADRIADLAREDAVPAPGVSSIR